MPTTFTTTHLQFPLTADTRVEMILSGHVTRGAISRLIAYLELMSDAFPEAAAFPNDTATPESDSVTKRLEIDRIRE